jgi:hypothetical protein
MEEKEKKEQKQKKIRRGKPAYLSGVGRVVPESQVAKMMGSPRVEYSETLYASP